MAASSFAQPEILEIPDETMNGFLETDELKAYKLQIERLLAKKPHMLSEKEEAIRYLSDSPYETSLRNTTLEDVFLEHIGKEMERR